MNLDIKLHKEDLPDEITFSDKIAIDCEFTGLNIQRDRLCLLQISSGKNDAHIIQLNKDNYNAPNLKNVLTNEFNLIIECDLDKNQDYFDKILDHLKKNCLEANLAKIEKEKNNITLYYKVSFGNEKNIKLLMDTLNKEFDNLDYSFYENKIVD